MRTTPFFTAVAFLAVSASFPARATDEIFNVQGSGITSSFVLTYSVNPNVGVLPGTSPNPVDPIGSYVVTGITGTFSDSNIGLLNLPITGIVPSNPAHPELTNLLAPHSFGFYPITNGVMTPGGPAPGLSYDDLFYPAGSPQAASDYPFHGGFFDIYGIVFTLGGGNAVNLWSNGDRGRGVSYGVGVTDGTDLLDYAQPVSVAAVPEPATWAMMIFGFAAVGSGMRRSRKKAGIANLA